MCPAAVVAQSSVTPSPRRSTVKRTHWLAGGVLLPLLLLLTAIASQAQPPAPAKEAPAFLKVWLPTADARLEVDGVVTRSTGNPRQFVSPPLATGKRYYYELKATFTQDGKDVTREKTVTVEPGKETEVDLREEPKKADPKVATKPEVKPDEKKSVVKKVEDPKKADPGKKVEAKKLDTEIEVPFVPTPEEVVDKMLEIAGVKEGDVVYDLGCGDGRIVISAVKKYKAKRGLGVDFDPDRVKDSVENAKKAGVTDTVEFKQGDVLKMTEKDFADVDVVTLYLLPSVNERLEPLLKKALKPGARVVSHDFDMKDWQPDKTHNMEVDGAPHTIYLWTVKKK